MKQVTSGLVCKYQTATPSSLTAGICRGRFSPRSQITEGPCSHFIHLPQFAAEPGETWSWQNYFHNSSPAWPAGFAICLGGFFFPAVQFFQSRCVALFLFWTFRMISFPPQLLPPQNGPWIVRCYSNMLHAALQSYARSMMMPKLGAGQCLSFSGMVTVGCTGRDNWEQIKSPDHCLSLWWRKYERRVTHWFSHLPIMTAGPNDRAGFILAPV